MASRGSGASITRRNYRLSTEPEKTKVTGIVNERLLSQYLQRIFPGSDRSQHGATYRYLHTQLNSTQGEYIVEARLSRRVLTLGACTKLEQNTLQGDET